MLPNTWNDILPLLRHLGPRSRPAYFLFCIFKHECSSEHINAAIGDISIIQCALYFTYAAKYRPRHSVCASSTLVCVKTSVLSVFHIQSVISIWKYLRYYWWYVDNSMRIIGHICRQIQSTTFGLRYVKLELRQIPRICTFAYSDCNMQLNVSQLLFVICRHVNALYTSRMLRNTWNVIRFVLCQLWFRSRTAYF